MSEHISGENLKDLALDGDRTISIGGDGDLETTEGLETVKQSVAIHAGDTVRQLVGEPLTGPTYADVQAELAAALEQDPQLETVNRVSVTEVNRAEGTVTVEVFTEYNNSFELEIPADTPT